MALITYENKIALNEESEIADINKVKADDMNEIKNVVNENYNESKMVVLFEGTNTSTNKDNTTFTNLLSDDVESYSRIDVEVAFTGTTLRFTGTVYPDYSIEHGIITWQMGGYIRGVTFTMSRKNFIVKQTKGTNLAGSAFDELVYITKVIGYK